MRRTVLLTIALMSMLLIGGAVEVSSDWATNPDYLKFAIPTDGGDSIMLVWQENQTWYLAVGELSNNTLGPHIIICGNTTGWVLSQGASNIFST